MTRQRRPTVIMKAAMTIDGQLAAADGSSQWITGPEARRDAHLCRAGVDAVMVGAGTVLADDPQLTVRLDGYDGTQPTPIIIAGIRPLPAASRLLARDPIVFSPRPMDVPGHVIVVPDASGQRVDLTAALHRLAELEIDRVLVEGGAGLLTTLAAQGLIDRGVVYYGAKLAGGLGTPLFRGTWATLADAQELVIESAAMVGGDVRVEFRIVRPPVEAVRPSS